MRGGHWARETSVSVRPDRSALAVDRDSQQALTIRGEMLELRRERERERDRARTVQAAIDRARASFEEGDFEAAVRNADDALADESGDLEALSLKSKALAALDERRRQRDLKRRAQQTVSDARAKFAAGQHQDALALLREFSPEQELVSQALRELEDESGAIQQKVAAEEARREELRRAEEQAQRVAAEQALAEKKAREDKERQEKEARRLAEERMAEEQRRKKEEEAQKLAEEQRRKEEERRKEEQRRKKEEEAQRLAAERERIKKEDEARRLAEVQRQREVEAQRQKEAEAQRQREAEAQRQKEAEARRQREAEVQRQKEAEEARRKKQAEEAQRQKQEDERRRRIEEARASQAAAAAAQKPVATDENVQFTVFRRSAIQPEHWYPLLVFAHLADRRPDAPPDEPDPIEEVKAQARQLLGDDMGKFRSRPRQRYPVAREGGCDLCPT